MGSVIPVTKVAITPEINNPLIIGRFEGFAVRYIAKAAAGNPNMNVGIFP